MRVGLVCPYSVSHPGGVQNHVLGLAGWLTGQGHQVSVLAPGRPADDLLAGHGLDPAQFTSAGAGLPVPYNGSVARINCGPLAAARVRRWLLQGNFEVVHVHEPLTPSIALLATALATAPVVATFHTANAGSPAMAIAQRLLPRISARVARGIAVSRVARAVAHRPGLVVIGNGIRVADHQPRPRTARWRGGERPMLTFIGRYSEPRKGIAVLNEALPAIWAAQPDLQVQVIGAGPRLPDPRVAALGALPDRERNELLEGTDVYLAPHTGRESFGLVLVEALAAGAPVVASDLPAFREVVCDEQGPVAELFTPGDPDDLARAVLRSLAAPPDRHLARGRALAERYDWSGLGPRILAEYRAATGVAGRSAGSSGAGMIA